MSQRPFTGPGRDPMTYTNKDIRGMMDIFNSRVGQPIQQMQGGVAQPMGIELSPPFVMDNDRYPELRVHDPRGPGGSQQQNPYDSLKKLFGENLQRSGGGLGGGLQDLFGRIGQQTGQMRDQGPPNIYETNQGPQHRMRMESSQDPMRIASDDLFRRSQQEARTNTMQPMRNEAGHDALNRQRQIKQQMVGRQRMPQPNQGYGNRFPGMQFSGPFSQPMMPQNYGMGGGYRQPPMMPQYPQPRMPYPQPMPQPGYGGGYGGGFGGRGPGGGYGNMYAQPPQMYGGGYGMPQRPPMFGGFGGGMQGGYGQQPQYGGGFGGGMQGGMQVGYGMQGGYGGGMGGMYNQPQRQPQYQNALGPSPFGGQMNQRQQPQQMGGGFQQMGGFGGGIMRSFY